MCRLTRTLVVLLLAHMVSGYAQAPTVVTRESTVTATVERVERTSRLVTLRSKDNVIQTVYVDPSVESFGDLRKGDVVTLRYVESVVVRVRPGAALRDLEDTTTEAQRSGTPQVFEQLTAVVTVERLDPQGQSITYRTRDGQKVLRHVTDRRVLEGLREGDRIEVTLTRERAVSIERVRR